MFAELQSWSPRRWVTAAAAGVIVALLVGLPTDVIPNPVFGRPVPVTWWSYPVLVFTAVLGGILAATYVRDPELPANTGSAGAADDERIARTGGFGGLLSFFAVGCPVCNKLVVIALGTVGAPSRRAERRRIQRQSVSRPASEPSARHCSSSRMNPGEPPP